MAQHTPEVLFQPGEPSPSARVQHKAGCRASVGLLMAISLRSKTTPLLQILNAENMSPQYFVRDINGEDKRVSSREMALRSASITEAPAQSSAT